MNKYLSSEDIGLLFGEALSEDFDEKLQKYEERASQMIDMPDEILLHQLRKEDQKRQRRTKQKNYIQHLSRVAVVVLAVSIASGSLMLTTTEAERETLFSMLGFEQAKIDVFRNEFERDKLSDWNEFWYPTYVPEGMKLTRAEQYDYNKGKDSILEYKGENGTELYIEQWPSSTFNMDYISDTALTYDIKISDTEGTAYIDEEKQNFIVKWEGKELEMYIHLSGDFDRNELEKIVRNLKYIE